MGICGEEGKANDMSLVNAIIYVFASIQFLSIISLHIFTQFQLVLKISFFLHKWDVPLRLSSNDRMQVRHLHSIVNKSQ